MNITNLRFSLITASLCLLACTCLAQPASAQPKAEVRTSAAIDLPAARKAGSELVQELLAMRPSESTKTKGALRITVNRQPQRIPFVFSVATNGSEWTTVYEALPQTDKSQAIRLTIKQGVNIPNTYLLSNGDSERKLAGNETMVPFAGSDFWAADLGLEFLHWPDQRLTGTEMKRGQSCRVLESINPTPATGAYSRVICWIDIDSGGIVTAEAYDAAGALLKRFETEKVKKVNGQYRLEEMDIRNRQTGSRTRIEYDLTSSPATGAN